MTTPIKQAEAVVEVLEYYASAEFAKDIWQVHDIWRSKRAQKALPAAQELLEWVKGMGVSEDNEKDVELLARAICRGGICGPRAHLDEQENAHWRRFTCEAKYVIRALKKRGVIHCETK